mmetsp:Transcript_20647/g.18295  ORF Transcript_20647/g.18295 Transcript_20647/m.18295 type:complete len:163 (+) Transcript_20647:269-757(+)
MDQTLAVSKWINRFNPEFQGSNNHSFFNLNGPNQEMPQEVEEFQNLVQGNLEGMKEMARPKESYFENKKLESYLSQMEGIGREKKDKGRRIKKFYGNKKLSLKDGKEMIRNNSSLEKEYGNLTLDLKTYEAPYIIPSLQARSSTYLKNGGRKTITYLSKIKG